MKIETTKQKKKLNIFSLLGRIIGSAASIFWFSSLFLHAIFGEEDLSLEGFLLTILIFLNITGIVIAYRNEKAGSFTIIISSLALSIFAYISAGRNEAFAIAVSGLPFLIAGILLFIGWKKSKKK
jgi:hypothetical protein